MSEITVISALTFTQRLKSTSAGSDMQAPFRADDKHPSVLMVKTARLIRPRQDTSLSAVSPKLQLPARKCRLNHRPPLQRPPSVVDSRPIWVVLCRAAKVRSMGQRLPFRTVQVDTVSLLIKRFGWGCGGSPAQVGVVPSLHGRSAGLLVDPCGGEFTHLQSLAPHAAEANGQSCQFTKTKDALWQIKTVHFYSQIKDNKRSTHLLRKKERIFLIKRENLKVTTYRISLGTVLICLITFPSSSCTELFRP